MKQKIVKNHKNRPATSHPSHPTNQSSWYYFFVPPCILSILTILVYYPSLHYDFQFDDIANIIKHYDIRHYSFRNLFFSGSRWISYWLNSIHYKIGRFDPFSYRVGNVLIHTTNGLLIFFVLAYALSKLKKQSFFSRNAIPIAMLTSLLFLLHPVQTQTISYVIQGQLEGMAMLFILSMALCFLLANHTHSRALKYLLTACFFCLAAFSCGTKEIAIISPLLIGIIDWFFVAQGDWKSLRSRLWFYAIFVTITTGIYLYFLKPKFFTDILGLKLVAKNNIGNVITHEPSAKITPFLFFISQFKVILHYLGIFIWPFNMSVEYDWVLTKSILAPDCLFPLLALIGLGFLIIKLLQQDIVHPLAFSAFWFFACIAPRSSIIPSPELLVDYKTYAASLGMYFFLAIVILKIAHIFSKFIPRKVDTHIFPFGNYLALLLLVAPLWFITTQRNTVWRSGLDFWGNILKNAPGKARAYNNYGVELSQQQKKFKESIPYFKQAIAMDSNYPDPHNNIAVSYAQIGETDLAIDALKTGLQINPYYPEGYNNLAAFFLQKKDYDHAEKTLLTAIRLRPTYGKAYFNLGRVYLEMGEKEKSLNAFKKACTQADLDNDFGFAAYGRACLMMQCYDEAIIAFKKVIALNPQYPDITFNLANAHFLSKNYEHAIQLYKQILASHPEDSRVWFNLGETHYARNEYQIALDCFSKIKNIMPQLPQVGIKIAMCHEKLGDRKNAAEAIKTVLTLKTLPEKIKETAETFLKGLTENRIEIKRA